MASLTLQITVPAAKMQVAEYVQIVRAKSKRDLERPFHEVVGRARWTLRRLLLGDLGRGPRAKAARVLITARNGSREAQLLDVRVTEANLDTFEKEAPSFSGITYEIKERTPGVFHGLGDEPKARGRLTCRAGEYPIRRLTLAKSGCKWNGPPPRLNTPGLIADFVRDHYSALAQESVLALGSTSRNELLAVIEVSLGGLGMSLADPRVVFGGMLASGAAAFVLVHNHPSGDARESKADVELTRSMGAAGRILGITLLDHVIVTSESYYSFVEHYPGGLPR